jgi:uncharacterized integral membrane protein
MSEQPPPAPRGATPSKKNDTPWGAIAVAVLALYAVLIVFLNREEVEISFVLFSTRISKLVLVLLCLGLGFVFGFLFDRWYARRKRKNAS